MAGTDEFSGLKCPPKVEKSEQILKVMKLTFDIIYSKVMALVYPPGILLLPLLLKCGAKHSPSGGRNRKNRVPAHKHALGPCNKKSNIEISTDQNVAGSLFEEH